MFAIRYGNRTRINLSDIKAKIVPKLNRQGQHLLRQSVGEMSELAELNSAEAKEK